MLIWAAERPERDALTLPGGVELASLTPHMAGDTPRRYRAPGSWPASRWSACSPGEPLENVVKAR